MQHLCRIVRRPWTARLGKVLCGANSVCRPSHALYAIRISFTVGPPSRGPTHQMEPWGAKYHENPENPGFYWFLTKQPVKRGPLSRAGRVYGFQPEHPTA
jgi:hypothetical protein